jgi:hypothetical protein
MFPLRCCIGSCPSIEMMVFSLNFSDPAASADLAVILMQEGLARLACW